jgi:hypothetical protein
LFSVFLPDRLSLWRQFLPSLLLECDICRVATADF